MALISALTLASSGTGCSGAKSVDLLFPDRDEDAGSATPQEAGDGGLSTKDAAPDPPPQGKGTIICPGTSGCKADSEVCCYDPEKNVGRCASDDDDCGGRVPLRCDDESDCDGSQVCCVSARLRSEGAFCGDRDDCEHDEDVRTLLCNPSDKDPCPFDLTCQKGSILRDYFTCQ